jgi:hypothetical protein
MRYLVGFGTLLVALGVFRLVGCSEETPLPLECVQDGDCDDANECTDDSCVEKQRWFEGELYGRCDISPVMDGTDCDLDGIPDITGIEDGRCVSGICEDNPCDDSNPCTSDLSSLDGSCDHIPCDGCRPCDRNGVPGVCIDGVCAEDPCLDVVCDDGDLCTDDWCDYRDATCRFFPRCTYRQCMAVWCDPADGSCVYTPLPDGTRCSCGGVICICPGTYVCSGGACVCQL